MDGDLETALTNADHRTVVQSGLVLVVRGPEPWRRMPILRECLKLGSDAGNNLVLAGLRPVQAHLLLELGRVILHDLQEGQTRTLSLGEETPLGPWRLSLDSDHAVLATLEGLSPAILGRIWTLGPGQCTLGRTGRRENQILLEHPTVSREQATLSASEGRFLLLAEARRNPTRVGGVEVSAGSTCELHEGDLLEFGELRLRFRSALPRPPADQFRLCTLGALEVNCPAGRFTLTQWRHQKAVFLLARLATAGQPVATERLLEEFWPEDNPEASRKRLTWNVSVLRGYLRDEARSSLELVRTHNSLQLQGPLWLDYAELQSALAELREQPDSRVNLRRIQDLYRGPFLEHCYLDWAAEIRQGLEGALVAGLQAALEAVTDPARVVELGHALLQIDPCHQVAGVRVMQAETERGRPQESLRLFERLCAALRRGLDQEPSIELLREQQRARLIC